MSIHWLCTQARAPHRSRVNRNDHPESGHGAIESRDRATDGATDDRGLESDRESGHGAVIDHAIDRVWMAICDHRNRGCRSCNTREAFPDSAPARTSAAPASPRARRTRTASAYSAAAPRTAAEPRSASAVDVRAVQASVVVREDTLASRTTREICRRCIRYSSDFAAACTRGIRPVRCADTARTNHRNHR